MGLALWGTIKQLEKQSGVFASEAEVDMSGDAIATDIYTLLRQSLLEACM